MIRFCGADTNCKNRRDEEMSAWYVWDSCVYC